MHIPSDNEIARFFEELSPEDFLTAPETTAFTTITEDYPRHGEGEFDRFVNDGLIDLADNGDPFAVLHNGEQARRYSPINTDENLAEFLVRIAKEVDSFGAKWVFIGMPGEASVGEVFNPNNKSEVARARRSGSLMPVINWYAESIEATSIDSRFGIIMEQDGEQRVIQSTFENGANPAFKRVLHTKE